jgi:hypothetical protein
MSAIRAMCPHCISPVDLDPAEILLTAASPPERTGSYAYFCRGCERVTVAPVSPAAFELLSTAGVRVERSLPPQPPQPAAPRFTVDDLITFHQLLNTRDWFAQLQR